MSITIFLLGLGICSSFTTLVTQAIKKMLSGTDIKYHNNILAAISSVIVAIVVAISYIIIAELSITPTLITEAVLLTILSWLCSMVGYDKVKQTIEQFTMNR